MNKLKLEVETKLRNAELVWGDRKYYISLKNEEETLAKVNQIRKLGYRATKAEYTNSYCIQE